jgi:hypothetical protein
VSCKFGRIQWRNGISRSTENIADISERAWCMKDKVSLQWRLNVQSNVIWFNGRTLRRPAKIGIVQLCTVVPAKLIFAQAARTVCDVMSSLIIRKGSVIRSNRDICDLQWQDKLPCILSESQAILSDSNFLWS